MLRLASILAPTDFSCAARAAAQHAAALARHFEADLTLLHVIPPPNFSFAAYGTAEGIPVTELVEAQRIVCSGEMESFAAEFSQYEKLRRELFEGDPATMIVEYARVNPVDAIVLATRGCGVFRRFVLGSVTAKVLHDVACPVWTGVHVERMKPWPCCGFRRILCAVDGDAENVQGLEWASKAAVEFGAQLVLVHAVPVLETHGRTLDERLRKELLGHAKEGVAEMMAACGVRMAEVRVEGGSAAQVVSMAARRENADLVVIGRSNESGFLGRLRANAYSIIRESPCPVVSV